MRITFRLLALVAVAVAASSITNAQSTTPPASSSNASPHPRFGDLRTLVLAEEREQTPLPVKRGPKYPDNAKHAGIEAVIPTAFILDTLGQVETRSITFLGNNVASMEFRASVCEFLKKDARFKPLVRDGQPRRAFVIQPFSFKLGQIDKSRVAPNANEQREAIRRVGWDSVTVLLKDQPHC